MKSSIVVFILGYLFCWLSMYPKVQEQKRAAVEWERNQSRTALAWIQDRRDWRDGKPFEYNYGPHGRRW